jgi:hypothetical protein
MPTPPSKKQLGYLKGLGYSGPAPKSSTEASHLIDELKGGASPAKAANELAQRRVDRARRDLEHATMYVQGLADMERQYHEAVGEPYISGLRLKISADERTSENEIYHNAFLPLEVALRNPEILTIPGIQDEELKRTPGHGKFVVGPGDVVERQKGERAPSTKRGSGCASIVLLAVALAYFAASAVLGQS